MKRETIEWFIWGITTKGEVINTIKDCKKPNLTKEYRQLEKRFNEKGDIQSFGYNTLAELRKQNNWINFETKSTI